MSSSSSAQSRLIGGKIQHFCNCNRLLKVQTSTTRRSICTVAATTAECLWVSFSGAPCGRGFGRGYALMHRRVRNEDPPNQPTNPDPVPVSDSDHEQIPNESASLGTDVTGVIGIMSTMMGRGKGFGRAYALHQQQQSVNGSVLVRPPSGRGFERGYALLHPSVVNNEQVPETPHDPVTVPDHGPFATYIDNAVNNAKKNVPRLRTKKK